MCSTENEFLAYQWHRVFSYFHIKKTKNASSTAEALNYDAQESPHKGLSDQNVNDVRMINPSWQAPITPIQKPPIQGACQSGKRRKTQPILSVGKWCCFHHRQKRQIQAYHQEDTNGGQLTFCLFFKFLPSLASAPKRSLNSGWDSQIPKWRYRI